MSSTGGKYFLAVVCDYAAIDNSEVTHRYRTEEATRSDNLIPMGLNQLPQFRKLALLRGRLKDRRMRQPVGAVNNPNSWVDLVAP
jgi:hypothetical protein